MEGEAAVAGPMLMAALVAGAGIAEQDGARRKHRCALARPVAEGATCHGGDAETAMLFLERPGTGAGCADHIGHPPAEP